MAMDAILGGKVLVNGTDIWTEYGVFLCEKKRGDRNNLKAIMVRPVRRHARGMAVPVPGVHRLPETGG